MTHKQSVYDSRILTIAGFKRRAATSCFLKKGRDSHDSLEAPVASEQWSTMSHEFQLVKEKEFDHFRNKVPDSPIFQSQTQYQF